MFFLDENQIGLNNNYSIQKLRQDQFDHRYMKIVY